MSNLAVVGLALQLLCAIHAAVWRRPGLWRWIVLGGPVVGCLGYMAMETWTALIRMRRDRLLGFAGADDRPHPAAAETAPNLSLRTEVCRRQGEARDAIELYAAALGQSHRHDPALMLGLARAYCAANKFGKCL